MPNGKAGVQGIDPRYKRKRCKLTRCKTQKTAIRHFFLRSHISVSPKATSRGYWFFLLSGGKGKDSTRGLRDFLKGEWKGTWKRGVVNGKTKLQKEIFTLICPLLFGKKEKRTLWKTAVWLKAGEKTRGTPHLTTRSRCTGFHTQRTKTSPA